MTSTRKVLESLDPEQDLGEVGDDQLAVEIERRMDEVRRGDATLLDGPTVIAAIRAQIGRP